MDMRFAASEPATNKALQEVGFLGGFGLFGDFSMIQERRAPQEFMANIFFGIREHWTRAFAET